jgi:hypothetical protein
MGNSPSFLQFQFFGHTALLHSQEPGQNSHPAEEWSTSYRKKTFRGRKTYIALDRSRGIECATDRVTEPGTAVGMQETYDEEMVRINVAELI